MRNLTQQAEHLQDLNLKVGRLFQKRMQAAQERFNQSVQSAYQAQMADLASRPVSPWELWMDWVRYSTDFAQRAILLWDTLRQRGNSFVAHERAGKPPVLHFDYETVADARTFERPANYALLRIAPPAGVTVDPKRRPYIVIDPRAGHGPGIGGFKDDSQVGVALRAGHPVYFVVFFPTPEPGQTLLDVCDAEARFVHTVRERHPDSPKPAILGNCQGGWAAMMLAVSNPGETGPIVINGAPMAYWGGAWREGEGDNPMRYAGGLLGGTWLASLTADLGHGLFDGAYLVQNMENLNPANTLWDKYYHVFANIDTEPPRFLDFERWWGGYFLMNREEIEWIVQNLFVGNKLWTGGVREKTGQSFDLRQIKSPIILFASLGDNITPPQQAFNWVADVYGSTEEIKARGQTIVGLLHQEIGHLGIFVSGKVAKKEHTQIVSVMQSIEALPPGLYGMKISEAKTGTGGKAEYFVEFVEHQLEEVMARLNRLKRADEKPFEAVAALSELNQRAYELFAQPWVQAFATEETAQLGRAFHPLRWQRWAWSDQNPWLWWLKPAAESVRAQRQATPPDQPFRKMEQMTASLISASLDFYRDLRDALSEALFFQVYGHLFIFTLEGQRPATAAESPVTDPRELPFVREALSAISAGGYPEALARVAALLARRGQPIPLSRMDLKEELIHEYHDLLPDLPRDRMRRLRGEQEIIVGYEPERALATLPQLLLDPADRKKLLTLVDRVLSDRRISAELVTPEQRLMFKRLAGILSVRAEEVPRLAAQEVGA